MTLTLTDENFEKEISNSPKPVLVDFWLPGCGPCSLISPTLEKISNDFDDKIILAKVNFDTAPLVVQRYGINMAPTVILFKEGKPLSGFIGVRPEPEIREWLENQLREDREIEKLIEEYEEYAKQNDFSLNPNKKIVEGIVKTLLDREKKFGFRYCPCRKITGNPEDDKKIICPCAYHRAEIKKDGHCLCGLFVK